MRYKNIHNHLFDFSEAMHACNQNAMSEIAAELHRSGVDIEVEFGLERLSCGSFVPLHDHAYSEYDDDGELRLPVDFE